MIIGILILLVILIVLMFVNSHIRRKRKFESLQKFYEDMSTHRTKS